MNHFDVIDGALQAEGVPLEALAEAVGTPAYVYSTATLTRHYRLLADAVAAHPAALGEALIAFAVKANSNLSVLATLARLGCGADTVSEGEIRRALKAGISANRIVFSGVGKTDAELAFAIEAGVRQINIESAVELDRLIAVAASKGAAPEIALRVNPKIGAGGHARITTGGATDKFGVPADEAKALYARASLSPHVTPVGLACHIGSQITTLEPLEAAFRALRTMTLELRAAGLSVTRLDLGGGLGVPYHGQSDLPSIEAYVAMTAGVLEGLDVEAAFEPGRLLAANAGVLLSRVIHVNERADGRRFLVLDAGMNDLMRPVRRLPRSGPGAAARGRAALVRSRRPDLRVHGHLRPRPDAAPDAGRRSGRFHGGGGVRSRAGQRVQLAASGPGGPGRWRPLGCGAGAADV